MADIVLNLLESRDARELDVKNIIHRSQFNDTIDLINSGIEKAIENKNNNDEHIHEAITILGTRGSGKTTFLLSVRNYFKKDSRVQLLHNIDPTLIEEKGHIFLYIISIINDLVIDYFEKNSTEFDEQKKWSNSLYKLSHGLPSMDGVGGSLSEANWQDPEYIMEKGLRAVSSARELSITFQQLIHDALRILEKDVFLLTFDDIDIDFKKGWSILETIRKYIHTSKIITVLSGDLKLYSLAIRRQYWESFGKSILINEGDKLNKHLSFNDRITELESQYILKVIKPERRIHLNSLYEKLQINQAKFDEERDIYFITFGYDNIEIEDYYVNILESFGIKNRYQSDAYISFLLGLPLRTQIQFLSQFDNSKEGSDRGKLIDSFLSDLIEKNVDTSLLDSNAQMLNVEILKLLLREHKLNELYQLQPVTADASLNSSLVALSFVTTRKIKSTPYLIFDYFIKLGYVRNLLGILGYGSDIKGSYNNLTPSIEGLCEYSSVFQNKVLRDITGNITSYLKGVLPNVNNWAGIISLPGLADTSKKSSETLNNRIDRVFLKASYDQRILGFIPLSISAFATINRSIPCYSIFNLLSTIGELIRKAELDDLSRGLAELSEVRTYGIPEFKSGRIDRIESAPFLSETGNFFYSTSDRLVSKLEKWVKGYNRLKLNISPHLLGKISTRFFYALNSIENIEDETNLGEMMHRRVVAFLNAVLIEDVRENFRDINEFNINNTNLRDEIFMNNLRFIGRKVHKVEFSRWIISCPLLLFYLNPETKLFDEIYQFLGNNYEELNYYRDQSIYSLLKFVDTKGNRQNRQMRTTTSSNYDRIIETLKERNIPYSWFQNSDDKLKVRENNSLIRSNLTDVFGENITSSLIRSFRNYIKRAGKEW